MLRLATLPLLLFVVAAAALQVAAKHRATKFLAIVSDSCIDSYPDRNVPTVFVYSGGEVKANIVGMAEFGGQRATDESEWMDVELGR